ncbi:hypothetical protein ABPG74_008387 [Tetrahymena malaccensis]
MENNRCNLPNHESSPFNFLCIDPSCKQAQKYACLGCIAFCHPNHKFVNYNDVYSKLNQTSQGNAQSNTESLEDYIEKKRMYTMTDISEVVKLLDMVQFPEVYSKSPSDNTSSSSNLENLKSKYNNIKSKPFHSMNPQELNNVIELFNMLQKENSSNNYQTGQQQQSEKQQQINKILNDNKKNIMIFINSYREQLEEGKEPISYREALDQIQNLKEQLQKNQQSSNQNQQVENLNKQISQLKSENANLKAENASIKDEAQMSNVKLQSLKEMNEQLKTRLQSATKSADNTVQITKLQNTIESLKQDISNKDNKFNNLQQAYKEIQSENEELKEVIIKAKLALEIYQIKFKQLTEQLEQNKRESIIANLRASILAAESDERRKQEIRRQQAQQGRVEVTECNVQ